MSDAAYGLPFWLCYLANTSLMIAVSVLFRYSDFVAYLRGTEMQLGLIVGIGMVGGLAMRVFQGVAMDRFGPRSIWLCSLGLFVISALLHLTVDRVDGIGIYLVRILLTTSLAGAFGASLTYVSLRVPESRIAEVIGMLGSSGFIGMALGPMLGDWLFRSGGEPGEQVRRMFLFAALGGAISLVFTTLATRGNVRRRPRRRVPMLRLVRRYHPGSILIVAMAMGLGLALPNTFLRAYTAELNIPGIKAFFLVYAVVAFIVRVATRRLTESVGVKPVILLGLAGLAASMLLYLTVRSEWLLAVPAVLAGVAHAFLFPAVVAGGSVSFPARYRGLATTLVLAMFDIGNLIGQPAVGTILHVSRRLELAPYPTMFLSVATALVGVGIVYAISPSGVGRRKRLSRAKNLPTPGLAWVKVECQVSPLTSFEPSPVLAERFDVHGDAQLADPATAMISGNQAGSLESRSFDKPR